MASCKRITLFIVTILIAGGYYQYHEISKPLPRPKININEYWGPGIEDKSTATDEKPIQQKVLYNDQTIADLRKKLNESLNLHAPLEGAAFTYGMNSEKLTEIVNYWRDDYLPRWKEREAYLNTLPHYLVTIQGLSVHYIHTKATYDIKGKKVVPLLLLHGWPGSVREFYEIIPKLALPGDELDTVFEIVCPSLPGYGWSEAAAKKNFGPLEMSVVLRNLMIRLGYDKFYIQGGDWGSLLGSNIATMFPENVLGYHSNMCFVDSPMTHIKAFISSFYPSAFIEEEYQDFIFPRMEKFAGLILESGYMHLQATKPDTIGAALTNNPVGLAAYILEKFSTWTDPSYRDRIDGGLDSGDFTYDSLLDNVMIYYLTNSITTSMRLYSEAFSYNQRGYQIDRVPTGNVPIGCARFKYDLAHALDWQLKDKFTNLIHSKNYKFGGHFIAMQKPDVLYNDFIEFVKKARKARGDDI